jgi:hypothetical protein
VDLLKGKDDFLKSELMDWFHIDVYLIYFLGNLHASAFKAKSALTCTIEEYHVSNAKYFDMCIAYLNQE